MKSLAFTISILSILSASAAYKYEVTGEDQYISHIGMNGRDGKDGYRCENGEDGHDGYDGDDVVIFYSELDYLKNIELNLSGGVAGKGGRPSLSSISCDRSYYNRGRDGFVGQFGNITLVKDLKQLPKEILSIKRSIRDLTRDFVVLKKKHFETFQNANEIFNENSKIKTNYQEFSHLENKMIETYIGLRSLNNEQKEVELKYTLNSKGLVVSSKKALIESSTELIDETFKVTLNTIIPKTELNKIKFLKTTGRNEKLTIHLEDKSLVNNKVGNTYSGFFYKYSKFIEWYVLVGNYSFPSEMVSIKGNIVSIKIGMNEKLATIFNQGQKIKLNFSNSKFLKTAPKQTLGVGEKIIFTVN